MKEWFYVQYISADNVAREYEIAHCKAELLTDRLDHYLKFSGVSVRATAYRISTRTGKPNFNTIVCETRIPF